MNKGWIIVNHFLKSDKFNELYKFFENASKKCGAALEIHTNSEVLQLIASSSSFPEFIIFWDKDIRLAKLLESKGIKLFNSAASIEACDDKYLTYLALLENDISTPYTLPFPMTYKNIGYTDFDFLSEYVDCIGFPAVIKENYGSFGQQVYLANSVEEITDIVKKADNAPLIMQKFEEYSSGRDIRINIVGNKIVAAMERYSDCGDFRANLSIGGKMRGINPDLAASNLALSAAKALNLDFCGVDLLFTKDGYTVCEVNSNAHFKNIFDLTGINFAEEIIKYIGEKI